MNLAQIIDAVPVVTTTVERDARFPVPPLNQRVQNLESGDIQRFTSGGWTSDFNAQSTMGAVSVRAAPYLAKGDGATDDTAAIQAAIDATAAAGGGMVLCPRPVSKYIITTIGIPSGVWLRGSFSQGNLVYYANLEQKAGTIGAAIHFTGVSGGRVTGAALSQVSLSKAGSAANVGIQMDYTAFSPLSDVQVFGFDTGIQLTAAWDTSFSNVFVRNVNHGTKLLAGGTDPANDQCNDLRFYGLNVETWATSGVQLVGNGAADHNHIFFYGLKVEGLPDGTGIAALLMSDVRNVFAYGAMLVIKSTSAPPAGFPMIAFNGDSQGVTLRGVAMDNQGVTVGSYVKNLAGTNSGILVEGTITNTTAAASNALVHNLAGTAADWEIRITNLFDPIGSVPVSGTLTRSAVLIHNRPAGAVESPAALALGNNNNYAIGDVQTIRVTADAGGSDVTGIAGGYYGRRIRYIKIAGGTLRLMHSSASSAAGNKIFVSGAANVTIATDGVADLEYDVASAVWRVCNVFP